MVHAGRGVRPRVLLVEDHLLEQRQPAAAVLLGPADAGPAVLREVAVPLDPLVVGLVLPARTALAAQLGEVSAEVLLQPGTDLGAERLVLLAVGQVHTDTVAYQALVWFLQARPQRRQECPCPSLRSSVRARCPACCGPLPRGTATGGVRRGRTDRLVHRPARPGACRRPRLRGARPRARRPRRGVGAEQHRLGGRRARRLVRRRNPGAREQPLHRARGGRHRRPHRRESRAGRGRVPRPHPDRRPAGSQQPGLGARGRRSRQPRLGEPARRRLARRRGRGAG